MSSALAIIIHAEEFSLFCPRAELEACDPRLRTCGSGPIASILCRTAVPLREGGPRNMSRYGIIRMSALWPLCRYRHNGHETAHRGDQDRALSTAPKSDVLLGSLAEA